MIAPRMIANLLLLALAVISIATYTRAGNILLEIKNTLKNITYDKVVSKILSYD